jgi:inward rectifier potassium channel
MRSIHLGVDLMQPRPKSSSVRSKSLASTQRGNARITNQAGKLEVNRLRAWYSYWRDPYHLLLTIPWPGFVLLVSGGYIALNVMFACLYLAGGNVLEGAEPGSFLDAFFFSVHTLGSIGYGVIAPKTTYANLIVTLEAITSLFAIAGVTGLAFARFSRPTSRVIFSRYAVIAPYNGVPTLMFRTANQRGNQILEAEIRVYYSCDEISKEGHFMRRFYELKLSRHHNPSFNLSWNIMHVIDEDSPFYSLTAACLSRVQGQLIVSLTGLDETIAQVIHARHLYGPQEVFWNHRLEDIVYPLPNGDRYLDYTYFDTVKPLADSELAKFDP